MFIIITELCSEWRSDKFRRMKGKEKLKEGKEGMAEDGMVGWHHQLNGHEFEQTLVDSEEKTGVL